jgi:hypothetical protein
MLAIARIQITATAIHRSLPEAAGHRTTTYWARPAASAAVMPGSITSRHCHP